MYGIVPGKRPWAIAQAPNIDGWVLAQKWVLVQDNTVHVKSEMCNTILSAIL